MIDIILKCMTVMLKMSNFVIFNMFHTIMGQLFLVIIPGKLVLSVTPRPRVQEGEHDVASKWLG